MLKRIIALLLSLAGLAEGSIERSYPVRCFLLWVFRRAESRLRHWLDDPLPGGEPLPYIWGGISEQEARRLARFFRAAAGILQGEQSRCQDMMARWTMPDLTLEDVISAEWDARQEANRAAENVGAILEERSKPLPIHRIFADISPACGPLLRLDTS